MPARSGNDAVLAAAAKSAIRLNEAIRELGAGREIPPGKLRALAWLTFDSRQPEQQGYSAWRDFVLRDATELLRSGKSLALCHSLPVDEKCALLDRVRQCPEPEMFPGQQKTELDQINSYLRQRFPDWVRSHVHGTRWKVADPDVLLISDACRSRYAWRDMLIDYCIEYSNYRLILTPRSIPRLERLLAELERVFPGYTDFADVTR